MNPAPWLHLDSGACEPALNIAVDEALLRAMPRLGAPVLRFYGWAEPAATFGYSQRVAEIERLTTLRPLVRRPTGGGLVPHDGDWTYSLAFPATSEWYALRAADSYRRVHQWIQMAFGKLGVELELAPECLKAGPGQCFVGHETSDLLWQGKKVAGAAQRRTRDGLLVQGSVQPPPLRLERAEWQKALLTTGESVYGAAWSPLSATDPVFNQAECLAQEKYRRAEYNRRR